MHNLANLRSNYDKPLCRGFFIGYRMSIERIRGRKLQYLRKRILGSSPLCVMCHAKGRIRAATNLDHIIALVNGGTNDDDNLQGLCAECHAHKTRVDLGQRQRVAIGLDGFPVDLSDYQR